MGRSDNRIWDSSGYGMGRSETGFGILQDTAWDGLKTGFGTLKDTVWDGLKQDLGILRIGRGRYET
jgi:hypothetical protein